MSHVKKICISKAYIPTVEVGQDGAKVKGMRF